MTVWGAWRDAKRHCLENLKERIYLEDLGVDVPIILKCFLNKYGARAWTELTWLRTGTSGGLL